MFYYYFNEVLRQLFYCGIWLASDNSSLIKKKILRLIDIFKHLKAVKMHTFIYVCHCIHTYTYFRGEEN